MRCGGLSRVLLQLKDPLELFTFFPRFQFRQDMTSASESDDKPIPSFNFITHYPQKVARDLFHCSIGKTADYKIRPECHLLAMRDTK